MNINEKGPDSLGVTAKAIQHWNESGEIKIVRIPRDRKKVPLLEIEHLTGKPVKKDVKITF